MASSRTSPTSSAQPGRARGKRRAEALALGTMAAGILMVCQPWLHELFRWGFLVTILGIVAFTIAAHLKEDA
jgi:4-hydroxybenzoate polyprenyltransferase